MNDRSSAGASRTRAILIPCAKIVVSLVLLWVLFSRVDTDRLLAAARQASAPWLIGALALYGLMILASTWRWGVLLTAQNIRLPFRTLTSSFLVATFFNNFLPSNIGGDVVRVADTAPAAGSRTLATTIVLLDRGLGLLGLVLIAAIGATAGSRLVDGGPVAPVILWSGFGIAAVLAMPALLRPHTFVRIFHPLRLLHRTWVDARLARMTQALSQFGRAPGALVACFGGAVVVQAVLVAFYVAIAQSLRVPIGFTELAVIVPISFIVQMVPLSMNGFGVREATFGFYFSRLGLPLESALLVSFMGAALIMLFSLSGAAAYLSRTRRVDQLDVSSI
jgi:uncharacterized membrane protein YbhN (UPF0104 family)